ncbi:MAG: hypothetical protein NTV86_17380 [Planctomycetota bacterium]|nr:hypothetical protein [Planctomycetota bacterium]
MDSEIERNRGEQPIARIIAERGLKAKDLVAASTEQITHKMVARACKGRWLTDNVRNKIRRALNKAAGKDYAMSELFNYSGASRSEHQEAEPVADDLTGKGNLTSEE